MLCSFTSPNILWRTLFRTKSDYAVLAMDPPQDFPISAPTDTNSKKPNVSWLYSHGTQNFGITSPLAKNKTCQYRNVRLHHDIRSSKCWDRILKVKIKHKNTNLLGTLQWLWEKTQTVKRKQSGSHWGNCLAWAPRISSWKAAYFSATQEMAWVM